MRSGQADLRKIASAQRALARVTDRRRFTTTPVPTGDVTRAAKDAVGTIFPNRVSDPLHNETVLKDGANNAKIGGDVLKGRLKGAHILTLTLEERATCPSSCSMWVTCYGNSMPHPKRWRHGPLLEKRIEQEIAVACGAHKHVLVRLHVLGDFYSIKYVMLWVKLLARFANLTVFGFTAWPKETEIGRAVDALRSKMPTRFCIRTSGIGGPWGSFTIDFPTSKLRLGDAIVCPEQVAAMNGDALKGQNGAERQTRRMASRHCGNCTLCWETDHPIVFVEH